MQTHRRIAAATYCLLGLYSSALWAQQETALPSLDGTEIKAWWFQPSRAGSAPASPAAPHNDAAKRPVVIAMHGCGGLYATTGARKGLLSARHQAMGEMLAGQGYHVLFPDSLTARGERSICSQPIGTRRITQQQRRVDALGALAWVRQQPWADGERVALLGWSHGGSAVLAATDATHAQVQASKLAPFTTALAFYPGCADALLRRYQPNTAVTFFLGAEDDWTPPAPCIALAEQLQAQPTEPKHQVELHLYPGAVHGFDNPLPGVREQRDVPSRLYPGRGVMAGQNPAARKASWDRVKFLLGQALQ